MCGNKDDRWAGGEDQSEGDGGGGLRADPHRLQWPLLWRQYGQNGRQALISTVQQRARYIVLLSSCKILLIHCFVYKLLVFQHIFRIDKLGQLEFTNKFKD